MGNGDVSLLPLATWLALATTLLLAGPSVSAETEDPGPHGPGLGTADVVRSFTLKTTGAVTKEVKGKKDDGKTGLIGLCDPKMFANFGIEYGRMMDREKAAIAWITVDPIETGATGEFKLATIDVSFFDLTHRDRRFVGPGTLKLTVHNASSGNRRMSGTVAGTKLDGLDSQKGKTLDITASFDLDFSCGVK